LTPADLTAYAKEIGLNGTGFAAAQHDPAIRREIARTIKRGVQGGVEGTPPSS